MSSFSRKLKRSEVVKKKKLAKKNMNFLTDEINSLPNFCSFCNKDFDLKKNADSWMVTSVENEQPLLICPPCFKEKNK